MIDDQTKLSKRDYFAIQIMQTMFTDDYTPDVDEAAEIAVEAADALIRALTKENAL